MSQNARTLKLMLLVFTFLSVFPVHESIFMGCSSKVRSGWLNIGFVLHFFFFFACLWTETKSIKDLLCGFRGHFPCGTQRVVPIAEDNVILPARIANHSAGFGSSSPLTGSRHVISVTKSLTLEAQG